MVDEKIVSRIQKLLALAGSSNENEAQSAMLKAQEMLAKYNLEMEDVTGTEKPKREVVIRTTDDRSSATWKCNLATIIANNFRCKNFFYNYHGKLRTAFMGFEEDADIALSMYNYALEVIDKGMYRCYRKFRDSGRDAKGVRGDYVVSFLKGLKEKLEEQAAQTTFALVLVTPKEVKDEYEVRVASNSRPLEKSATARQYNSEASKMGYEDGKEFGETKKIGAGA